jgi:hypothetical protein
MSGVYEGPGGQKLYGDGKEVSPVRMTDKARWIVQEFRSGWGDDRFTKLPLALAKLEDEGYEIITASPIAHSCDVLIIARLREKQ